MRRKMKCLASKGRLPFVSEIISEGLPAKQESISDFNSAITKMPSFAMVVALPMFIFIGFFIHFIADFIGKKLQPIYLQKLLISTVLIFIAYHRISLNKIVEDSGLLGDYNTVSEALIENKKIFTGLELTPNTVLFNVKGRHYVEAMFYTNVIAYPFIPDVLQCESLIKRGYKIAVFESYKDTLPSHLLQNKEVNIIKENLAAID